MCLKTTSEKKIAKNSMLSFKQGYWKIPFFGKFESAFTNFYYNRFKVQRHVSLKPDAFNDLDYGYHSYSFPRFFGAVFIIPKGSEYYEGYHNNDDFVYSGYTSSSIVWIGGFLNPLTWITVLLIKLGIVNFNAPVIAEKEVLETV